MIFKDALKEILVTSRESFLSRVWLIIYDIMDGRGLSNRASQEYLSKETKM